MSQQAILFGDWRAFLGVALDFQKQTEINKFKPEQKEQIKKVIEDYNAKIKDKGSEFVTAKKCLYCNGEGVR